MLYKAYFLSKIWRLFMKKEIKYKKRLLKYVDYNNENLGNIVIKSTKNNIFIKNILQY